MIAFRLPAFAGIRLEFADSLETEPSSEPRASGADFLASQVRFAAGAGTRTRFRSKVKKYWRPKEDSVQPYKHIFINYMKILKTRHKGFSCYII